MGENIEPNQLTYLMVIFIATCLMSQLSTSTQHTLPWKNIQPKLLDKLRTDLDVLESVSYDFGNMNKKIPAAVLNPSSVEDIVSLINLAYRDNSVNPPGIAARGSGHSVRGQPLVSNGVIVNMTSLNSYRNGSGVVVYGDTSSGFYADVGGEQLWFDVLNSTLQRGLAPVTFTDYLYATVGGTLSNAGIGGNTFRYGPQISNVLEMDVVTGKGELVTCSPNKNSELFYGVLGGLGQFGIITRARIVLDQAPKRAKWVRMLYRDFSAFTSDQERLISVNGKKQNNALDFLEGHLLLDNGSPETSFFPLSDRSRIISLVKEQSIIYCLEVAKYYDDSTQNSVDKELQLLFKGLSFIAGFMFEKDVSYIDFLNRVRSEELVLRSQGLWDVPHPWLNLFIPKSRILELNKGVFTDIVLKRNITKGVILVYPMNRNKWDDRMSAVTPDADIFYTVELLHSAKFEDNLQNYDDQSKEIIEICDNAGIKFRRYLPPYKTQNEWIKQFGSKWDTFQQRKALFDPKMMLSPGQGIFNPLQIKDQDMSLEHDEL